MKAGAKKYLLSKFDRHELRGKAAGEPARATRVRLRWENFPNGAGVSPNLNRGIVERAYWSPDFILWAVEEMARFEDAHLRKPNKKVGPSLVGEPTSQSRSQPSGLKFSASHANIICTRGPVIIGMNRHGNPFDQNSKAYCSRAGGLVDRRCSAVHRRSRFPHCTRHLEASEVSHPGARSP